MKRDREREVLLQEVQKLLNKLYRWGWRLKKVMTSEWNTSRWDICVLAFMYFCCCWVCLFISTWFFVVNRSFIILSHLLSSFLTSSTHDFLFFFLFLFKNSRVKFDSITDVLFFWEFQNMRKKKKDVEWGGRWKWVLVSGNNSEKELLSFVCCFFRWKVVLFLSLYFLKSFILAIIVALEFLAIFPLIER